MPRAPTLVEVNEAACRMSASSRTLLMRTAPAILFSTPQQELDRAWRASSAVEILICGAGGSYGVIGGYALETARFGPESADFVQSLSNTLAAAIERRNAEHRLAHMAQYDALTEMPNRTIYLEPSGRAMMSPSDFVPIPEETGLILPVGDWVVATVCARIISWQSDGLSVCPVAVNVSARQFRQTQLATVIGDILRSSGVDAGLLEVEWTESSLMVDVDLTVESLRQLTERGIRLSIDDVGTGYSSLAYLKRFPIDTLKIDGEFIREVTTDADSANITLAIINLTRMGCRATATVAFRGRWRADSQRQDKRGRHLRQRCCRAGSMRNDRPG